MTELSDNKDKYADRVILRSAVSMVGAGVLASLIYWLVATGIVHEFTQMQRMLVYLGGLLGSIAFCSTILVVWNRNTFGSSPSRSSVRQVYSQKSLSQAAGLGVIFLTFPIGLPTTVAQLIWQPPASNELISSMVIPLVVWLLCGALFGILMKELGSYNTRKA